MRDKEVSWEIEGAPSPEAIASELGDEGIAELSPPRHITEPRADPGSPKPRGSPARQPRWGGRGQPACGGSDRILGSTKRQIRAGRAWAPPPSEPDERVSRLRLSSWWFTSKRTDARAGAMERAYPMHFNIQQQHSSDAERSCDGRLPLRQGVRRAGLLSLGRHSHRCCFLRSSSHESTFLRSLRSISITRLHRYYGRSDSCSPRLFGTLVLELRLFQRTGLPDLRQRPC
jgi:hypothetical protein